MKGLLLDTSEQTSTSSEVPQPSEMLCENAHVNVREEFLSTQLSASGPLPIPSSFRKYDEVLLGSTESILKMAEMACLLKSAESTFCAFGAV